MGRGLFRKIFVQSRANLEVLRLGGIPEDKIVLLRVGIDKADRISVATNASEDRQTESDTKIRDVTLLYFGAIRKIRGFDALVDAFSQVVQQVSNVKLKVLARGADDKEAAAIEARLERLGLAHKIAVTGGWLSREQVWNHIESSDVVVLPFIIVPSDVPIAILEAMARGKPVIGSPVDGIPELIEGHGLIADPLNPAALASAIVSLVQDKSQRNRLGNDALTYMQSYPDWEQIGHQLLTEVGLG